MNNMNNSKFDIKIDWVEDEYPDLSYLGVYKEKRPNVPYVDRKNNILIIPTRTEQKSFVSESCAKDFENKLNQIDIPFNSWIEESEDGENYFIVEYPYFEEIPFSCRFNKHEYQFVETCNYQNPQPEEYKYIIADTKLLDDYGYDWHMIGCTVTASIKGIELGSSSLFGIESNMAKSEYDEIANEVVAEAIQIAEEKLIELKSI